MVQRGRKSDYFAQCLKFKYIQCYGSTRVKVTTVELSSGFKYIQCYGSTSGQSEACYLTLKFKYIQCYGSTSINPNRPWDYL